MITFVTGMTASLLLAALVTAVAALAALRLRRSAATDVHDTVVTNRS